MRVVLVGSAAQRARLRAQLAGGPVGVVEIVGEFPSLAAAYAADTGADAFVVAPDAREGDEIRGDPGDPGDNDEFAEALTAREIEVLELLAEGLPNKAIAVRLGISDQTVKFHVASISGKLGAANRTDAVRRAVRRGLITL